MFLKDRLTITSERTYSDEGFLMVPARISRSGIQEYFAGEMGLTDREPEDVVRVFRPVSEVFSDLSLSSFSNKPITDNHPPELVTSKNSKQFSVGHAGPEVVKDGNFVKTVLHITDAEAISKIESGKVELSNGYTADIDFTSGISEDGDQYDAIQRNIKGNHIALVERGRAGPACRLADNSPNDGDICPMAKITIDGVDFEVTDQAAQAVGKLQSSLIDAEKETSKKEDEFEKKAKEEEDEKEELKKDHQKALDSVQAKFDDAASKVLTVEAMDKQINERMVTINAAVAIKPDFKWVNKDCKTIRKEIVADMCSNVSVDSVSDDYVQSRFDSLAETFETNSQQHLDAAFGNKIKIVDDKKVDLVADARSKMASDSRNAYKRDSK